MSEYTLKSVHEGYEKGTVLSVPGLGTVNVGESFKVTSEAADAFKQERGMTVLQAFKDDPNWDVSSSKGGDDK